MDLKIKMPRKLTAGLVVALMAALVIVSELAVQLHLHSKYRRIAADIGSRRQEVARAKSSGLNLLAPEELARLQKRVAAFQRGFVSVSQTAVILDGISDQAERSGVRVVGVNSAQPAALKAEGDVDFEMGGAKYYNLPIVIKIEGSSRSIADFLRSMAVSSERIFVVDTFQISKTVGRPSGILTCELTISFFSNNV